MPDHERGAAGGGQIARAGTQVAAPGQSRGRRRTTRGVEKRGRGLRGALVPPGLPARKTRAERFDAIVLDAFEPIEARWRKRLAKLDIAVDDVPRVRARNPDTVTWPPEILADGPVPLSRLIPAGIDSSGQPTRARIVLFRRALELRGETPEELVQLIHEVLVQQVATYLGLPPDMVAPNGSGDLD
ncbi:metallopeptidase family protein [Hoyosella sp. G463]|uniref:Metallopeptidase family protein n=1 Tax=Lolliginicoccus lacisalsi TaxID=2742202 RepID=A0A927JC54_9ACTN|nr:metallopeptidase family protein [Lolliginicoccus lacisalsi]MBD8506604.1 metallopeptidase family protein [Lolliginicoccus lacisalsi]